MKPNDKDIEAARQYLKMRLDAEASFLHNLDDVLCQAAEKIVYICYRRNVNPRDMNFESDPRIAVEVEEVVQWLREVIEDMLFTLATASDKEHSSMILAWVCRERDGNTLEGRLDNYLSNFKKEMEVLIGAALILGLAKNATARSIASNLHKPWDNPDLAGGIERPLSYGRGRTNSMATAIGSLGKFSIGEGWMKARHIEAQLKEAAGFYTFRNSYIPCSICDSYAERFHTMDEPTPPLHLSCVCGTIYVNHLGETIRMQ